MSTPYNVAQVRSDFPILSRQINGRRLAYLDSGASTQRPRAVIDAVDYYETQLHSNVHRGVHTLSQLATDAFEAARERVRRYINATSTREIIFVRGTTEAINLIAQVWGGVTLQAGDEIIVSALEHHANLVPWQMACAARGATLRIAPIDADGQLQFDQFLAMLGPRTRMVAMTHVSNVMGSVLPVQAICAAARERGIATLIDGAQAVAHETVDVRALGCDFYAFSSHKLYGPTGIGVLYGREALLEALPPWQGGGDMIRTVSFAKTTYNDLPYRFEAGTPHISGAVGLAAAIDYLESLGIERVHAHEQHLLQRATAALREVPGLTIIGEAARKGGVISFLLEGVHPHDLGTILDAEGVAIRAGHHCAMPVMEFFDVPATARASFGCYTDEADIEQLLSALATAREVFG